MDHFIYRGDRLFAEDVAVADIARQFGTPCYIYSRATLERHYRAYLNAFDGLPHMICYAVKANSNLAVLSILVRLGAGFDIVSGGELQRVIAAGGDPGRVLFSGLGKTAAEIRMALEAGIHCFNVESEAELDRIAELAREMGVQAPISIRVNPDVDAKTHPYISTGLKENKFGIPREQALDVYRRASNNPALRIIGVDCHIGSQLTSTEPYLDAIDRLLTMIDTLGEEGIVLSHCDIGGGLGVTYGKEQPPHPETLIADIRNRFLDRDLTVLVEPGRSIAANAGIFVTRVEYLKRNGNKHFAVVDGAMNDLLRPALYNAWQDIVPVVRREGDSTTYDVVGPVCESSDFLGKERELCIQQGDLLAVRSAGAYGFVMSSNYNTRNRVPEVIVDGGNLHLGRRRETLDDQLSLESPFPA